jgi:hypothetical protein
MSIVNRFPADSGISWVRLLWNDGISLTYSSDAHRDEMGIDEGTDAKPRRRDPLAVQPELRFPSEM